MSLSVRLPSRSLTQQPNISLGDLITQMIDLFGRPPTHPREWKAQAFGASGMTSVMKHNVPTCQTAISSSISLNLPFLGDPKTQITSLYQRPTSRHVSHLNSPPPSTSFRLTSPLPLGSGLLCPSPSVHPIMYIILNVAGMPSFASSPCNCL